MTYIRVSIANQAGSRASRDEKSPKAGTSGRYPEPLLQPSVERLV